MARVLIGSPIRQKPRIIAEFLTSLTRLETAGLEIEFAFVDDEPGGSEPLRAFAAGRGDTRILPGVPHEAYACDEIGHHWPEEVVWKVADYKNRLIRLALDQGCVWLFLIDSDVMLHPRTLVHLVSLGKDIVTEVVWTATYPTGLRLPSVWFAGPYRLYACQRGERLDQEETTRRALDFLAMLRRPGTYKVGGLAACTLFSRRALSLGVSFAEIYNADLWGEDRHLCLRAAVLGLELYADTHYPPFHVYRDADLAELEEYKKRVFAGTSPSPSL